MVGQRLIQRQYMVITQTACFTTAYDHTLSARFSSTTQSDKMTADESMVRTAPPLKRAAFEVIEQLVAVTKEVDPAWTAPPKLAVFEVIRQLVAVTVEPPAAATAPPMISAAFEVIVQSVAVIVEEPDDMTTPPQEAEFKVIVQLIALTTEPPSVAIAPPRRTAEFEVIVQ